MIDQALIFIQEFLNNKLKFLHGYDHDLVVLGNLDDKSDAATKSLNRIILSMVNLEHETNLRDHSELKRSASGSFEKSPAPLHINLYVLLAANFSNDTYLEGLRAINSVMSLIHSVPLFTRQKYPAMHESLEKLSFEIVNIPNSELGNLWNVRGASYVPSILYKVRMVTITPFDQISIIPEVTSVSSKPIDSNK